MIVWIQMGQEEAEVRLYILRAEGKGGITLPGESSRELLNCWVGEQRAAARQELGKEVGEVKDALHPKRAQTC